MLYGLSARKNRNQRNTADMNADIIYRKKSRNHGKSPITTSDGTTVLTTALNLLRNPSMRSRNPIVWGIADDALKQFDEITSGLD